MTQLFTRVDEDTCMESLERKAGPAGARGAAVKASTVTHHCFRALLLTAIGLCAGPSAWGGEAPQPDLERRALGIAAVERIRDSHRTGGGRSFAERYPHQVWLSRADDIVRKTRCLAERYGVEVGDEALTRELARMLRESQDPDRLQELLDALGNDPVLVKECLVRPVLVERLLRRRVAWDAELQAQAREAAARLAAVGGPEELRRASEAKVQLVEARAGSHNDAKAWERPGVLQLQPDELARMAADFPAPGEVSSPRETITGIELRATLEKGGGHLVAIVAEVPKVLAEIWWQQHRDEYQSSLPGRLTAKPGPLSTPKRTPAAKATTSDPGGTWWVDTLPSLGAYLHTAVWTGSEMIVWGGSDTAGKMNLGGRYDPVTDTWSPTSLVNAPEPRARHVAVWTGTEMIVWGGLGNGQYNWPTMGGRYDPSTDSWSTTSTTDVPSGRIRATAVWTGSEMIVWGGFRLGETGTGGRYNPSTDTWTATNSTDAPTARSFHSAVWTGSEMIVWGGSNDGWLHTGGRYDPQVDSWTALPTTGAPAARALHAAVWTGSEMIVWGGAGGTAGGRYDPAADLWQPMSTAGSPQDAHAQTAVWTGQEMLIWGGVADSAPLDEGGLYDPATDDWRLTTTVGAPLPRYRHTAVWTGAEVIVWGGYHLGDRGILADGGRYDPDADAWIGIETSASPESRYSNTTVWTGTEMILWGGRASVRKQTGGCYEPATHTWRDTSLADAPSARELHSAVWTGHDMIVWGGDDGSPGYFTQSGGRYDPATDHWSATDTVNAPLARYRHTAVWTGNVMLVWGGKIYDDGTPLYLATGGAYDPGSDSWSELATPSDVEGRCNHTGVWTGSEMVVWGGENETGVLDTGGRYHPVSDSWNTMSTVNARASTGHRAVWTGGEMIAWGGHLSFVRLYNPSTDTWSYDSFIGRRDAPSAVWSPLGMIAWGGYWNGNYYADGAVYDPNAADYWLVPAPHGLQPRHRHSAVWTGSCMVVWGGHYGSNMGIYTPYLDDDPVVSNVRARQLDDGSGRVEVLYDLSEAPAGGASVSVAISATGGAPYTIAPPPSALAGDVGPGITAGRDRRIVWNARETLPAGAQGSAYRAAITAVTAAGSSTAETDAPPAVGTGKRR